MTNEKRGVILGLTGPTGAGKGVVAAQLTAAGIPVVDTDRLARDVTAAGHPCLIQLAAAFSPAILREDGTLDRAQLASLAFASPEATARLNAITHPHIFALAEERLAAFWEQGMPVAVVDAPVLFESGMDRMCDRTVAVLAPAEVRLARICARDGLSEAQAKARMSAQPDDRFYEERADDLLYNEGDLFTFEACVNAWIARLREELT